MHLIGKHDGLTIPDCRLVAWGARNDRNCGRTSVRNALDSLAASQVTLSAPRELIGNGSPELWLYPPGTYKVYSLLRLQDDYMSIAIQCVHNITGPAA